MKPLRHQIIVRDVLRTTTAMALGRMHLLSGCRMLDGLRLELSEDYGDLFNIFRATASDNDDVPVGAVRQRFSQDYLARADAELDDYLSRARADIDKGCRRVLRTLSGRRRIYLSKSMTAPVSSIVGTEPPQSRNFPDSLCNHWMVFAGAQMYPTDDDADVPELCDALPVLADGSEFGGDIWSFFSSSPADPEGLWLQGERWRLNIPPHFQPFARDATGRLYLVGELGGEFAGEVFLWDNSDATQQSEDLFWDRIRYVAGSFDEFLGLIKPFVPASPTRWDR